jgi:glutathione S-transferase
MKLHWSPYSPYVRKVVISAHELGLQQRLELVRTRTAMAQPNVQLLPDNPLSKIPTLVLDNGESMFDSLTICEYLDHLAGGGILFPQAGAERWRVLTWHALSNGLLDVLILWRNEREKPEERRTPEWLASFALKTTQSLDRLEALTAQLGQSAFGIAHISLGCCLSYMDFRFADLDWRAAHRPLAAWHETFRQRPSALATEIPHG